MYMKTDIGLVRKTNEDSLSCLPPNLYVVADGMGGHAAGEIASRIATDTIKEYVKQHEKTNNPQNLLEAAVREANIKIYEEAQSNRELTGMGTTITAVYLEEQKIHWGHVGDSRIYLIRDRQLQQLTQDHSLVWDLLSSGLITRDEAENHPQRNILTRALGTYPTVTVSNGLQEWREGDLLLLCTDGLTGMLNDQEISQIICAAENNIKLAVDNLVEAAKVAGGCDNITVILLKHGDA